VFKFLKKKQLKILPISGFDIRAFLEANPDVERSLKDKKYKDIYEYLQLDGLRKIENGELRFHKNFVPFNEEKYLTDFPDVKLSVESQGYLNGFEHFKIYGYMEILTGRRKWYKVVETHNNSHIEIINGFDLEAYLLANEGLNDAIEKGIVEDAKEHFENFGLNEIKSGARIFHKDFDVFDEVGYVKEFNDVADAINRGEYKDGFEHFCKLGYIEIISGKRFWKRKIINNDINTIELQLIKNSAFFDESYYLDSCNIVGLHADDTIPHYLFEGWRLGLNPSERFNTNYYLSKYEDIKSANINPLIHFLEHGINEGRKGLSYEDWINTRNFEPLVSIIIPNYNHEKYLKARIDSVIKQTYTNFELIILDDCSTDNSRILIGDYAKRDERIRTVFNTKNSGNVFKQWRKGIEHSNGDLIWICESDDFSQDDFLEKMVNAFKDYNVNIAFGRIQFSNSEGEFQDGLDSYREGAESGIWNKFIKRSSFEWFQNAFGINNVIANVGGCVFRKPQLMTSIWAGAEKYKILGDWYLYIHFAQGGRIAYDPTAITYFRQHDRNTSVSSFVTSKYYTEHSSLMNELCKHWTIPRTTKEKFVQKVQFQYEHFGCNEELGDFYEFFSFEDVFCTRKKKIHVLIAMLGFHSGGGELFPIHLANELQRQGCIVSLAVLDMDHIEKDMYQLLENRIAVYSKEYIDEIGPSQFIKNSGIDVIHSHMMSLDMYFLKEHKVEVPYLVSLHGSYESSDENNKTISSIAQGVSHWVYTADKNLNRLSFLNLSEKMFTKMDNAMPIDNEPFPNSRAELGIDEDTFVFTLVARGIKRKGWRAAIFAFNKLIEDTKIKAHLLLCGDGEETRLYRKQYGSQETITFLGYQSKIHGLYRISDCAIVPTRFEGESYPLCIIQAMQVGIPIIATDVGEIKNMLKFNSKNAGILISNERNTEKFIINLTNAMKKILEKGMRDSLSIVSKEKGQSFSLKDISRKYINLYIENVK